LASSSFIFRSGEAPSDLVKQYLGRSCNTDNFYATLNSAVFSDESFSRAEGRPLSMELST
jgi:hypothetical protein